MLTKGNEFWLSPMVVANQPVFVEMHSERATTATVTYPSGSQVVNLVANQSTVVTLPTADFTAFNYSIVSDQLIHVESPDSIQVMLTVGGNFTGDVSIVLPTHELGTEYLVSTWDGKSQFGVIATEDDTDIEIIPSDPGLAMPADIPIQVTLNKGEIYLFGHMIGSSISSTGSFEQDYSGSVVRSVNCKPISVWGGNLHTAVVNGTADYIIEQIPPIEHLGTSYVIAPFDFAATPWEGNGGAGYYNELQRFSLEVVATAPNTDVYVGGVQVTTLSNVGDQFILNSQEGPLELSASQPILTTIFFEGPDNGIMDRNPSFYIDYPKDPAMGIVLPASDWPTHVQFRTPDFTQYEQFNVNIISRDATPNIMLDGVTIPVTDFLPFPGNSSFRYAIIPLSAGLHDLSGTTPFQVMQYGRTAAGTYLTSGGGLTGGEEPEPISLVPDSTIESCVDVLLYAPVEFVGVWWSLPIDPDLSVFDGDGYSFPVAGVDTIIANGSNAQGCPVRYVYEIVPDPDFLQTISTDQSICPGASTLLEASLVGQDYVWQDGTPGPQLEVDVPGTYQVELTQNSCAYREIFRIQASPLPKVDLGPDTALCQNQSLILNVETGSPGDEYVWQDGNTDPIVEISDEGIYWVKVTNECGESEDEIIVSHQICGFPIYTPTAFTPNGDGVNDTFRPISPIQWDEYTLTIYHRWGPKIFTTTSQSQGWSGTFNGEAVQSGVYVWTLFVSSTQSGQSFQQAGSVTLIR